MAQMGLGYGSEFQLMRFMGRHRHELESTLLNVIKETTKVNDSSFDWLDFEYASRKITITGDKELSGLTFLKQRIDTQTYEKISQSITNIGTFFKDWQSWDAVFLLDGTYYLVEAKAHIDEIKQQNNDNGGKSRQLILKFMTEIMKPYGVVVNEHWLGRYYQFANRIATVAFLNHIGVKTKVVYVYFINGYHKQIIVDRRLVFVNNKDTKQKSFEAAIQKEREELGLCNVDLTPILINPVFINANKQL